MENTPFPVEKHKLRKAYFQQKIPEFLVKIQEKQELTVEEWNQIKEYLQELRNEEIKMLGELKTILPEYGEDQVMQEISEENLTENEKTALNKEREKRLEVVSFANGLLKKIANDYMNPKNPNPTKERIMEVAFELIGLSVYIDEERLYRKQLYKKKVVEFEKMGKQRKTAEEYAQLTPEYREYKRLADLHLRMQMFDNNARRVYGF